MGQIIAVANQKGGVAKTTTAHQIGAGLQHGGFKVLFVDLDGQQNLSYTLRAMEAKVTIYDVLTGKTTAEKAITKTATADIMAASSLLTVIDQTLKGAGADQKLKKALQPLKSQYDYIVIDTPPALGILTINAFTAADKVIIPAQADIYSLQGIGQLYRTINAVQQKTNPGLTIAGIVLTRHNGRTLLSKDMAQLIEETAGKIGTKVYKSIIREGVAVKEAQALGLDIFTHAPKSNPGKDYSKFLSELLKDL